MDVFEFRKRSESRFDDRTEELAERVIGAAIEVHRHLGPGLPEVSYLKALSFELTLQGILHECECPIPIYYKGRLVAEGRMDFLVEKALVVELKVVEVLGNIHRAQALSYLRATKLQLALILNFNVIVLKDGIKRVINTL